MNRMETWGVTVPSPSVPGASVGTSSPGPDTVGTSTRPVISLYWRFPFPERTGTGQGYRGGKGRVGSGCRDTSHSTTPPPVTDVYRVDRRKSGKSINPGSAHPGFTEGRSF